MNVTASLTMDASQNTTGALAAGATDINSVTDSLRELDFLSSTMKEPLSLATRSVPQSVTESVSEAISNTTSWLNETVSNMMNMSNTNGSLADQNIESRSGLAGNLAFPSDRLWVSQGIRSPLLSPSELTIVLIVTAVASIVFLIVILFVIFTTKRKHLYHIIPSSTDNAITYDYIYKPLIGSLVLDEEYENTFVGVSIPLLQDNTKV